MIFHVHGGVSLLTSENLKLKKKIKTRPSSQRSSEMAGHNSEKQNFVFKKSTKPVKQEISRHPQQSSRQG